MRDNSLDCTKCGSTLKSYTRTNECFNLDSVQACNNKKCEDYDIYPFETREAKEYQQRLEQVLSKFEQHKDNKDYYIYKKNNLRLIDYQKNMFPFQLFNGATGDEYIGDLSLNVVKILLEDLEKGD